MLIVVNLEGAFRNISRSNANNLRSRRIFVDPLFPDRVSATTHDAIPSDGETWNTSLAESANTTRKFLIRSFELFVRLHTRDAANGRYRPRPSRPQDFGSHDSILYGFVKHNGKVEGVLEAKTDGRVDDRRIQSHLDIAARTRVRCSINDIETCEKDGSVQRPGYLAGATADAVDQFAFSNDGSNLVAVRFVHWTYRFVEVERLTGQKDMTIEFRRSESQIECAVARLVRAIVVSLEFTQHCIKSNVFQIGQPALGHNRA